MAVTNEKKGIHLSVSSGAVVLGMTALGAVLYFTSHTTGYYIFGQMHSGLITALVAIAAICEAALLFFSLKSSRSMFAKLLPFFITALLAAAAMTIVGDRVEGIGNCIVSDYDSGHGGEEAIYMSLVGAVSLLTAMIYTIIGAFTENGSAPAGRNKTLVMIFTGAGLAVAAIAATVMLTGTGSGKGAGTAGGSGASGGSMIAGTYTISFNQANENIDAETMPDYQFLSANMGGLARADARFYIDVTLTLDGAGAYSLVSDAYVLDSGKRAEIGDPSGLGLVYKTTSEGIYTDNGDGTVDTQAASHVKFELKTDTYSEQMKSMMAIDLDGSNADGEYDSADYPVLLDYVPATRFTLSDGAIVTYGKAGLAGEFRISFNQASGNTDVGVMPAYQFLSADMGGLVRADARFYIDIVLNLDGAGSYTLTSDAYVIDSGKRAEIGDPSGLGLVYKTAAKGSYEENDDGTVTTAPAGHVTFELKTDTYSEQMKSMMKLDLNGSDADGEYDSAEYPVLLDYVPETIWTLEGDTIVTYKGTEEEEGAEENEEPAAEPAESLIITSDDGGTEMVFNPDGTYVFKFAAYNIEDPGTWTYEGGKLVVTNANGAAEEAEGDPLKLHYVSAVSDQLGGDYTISAADLPAGGSASGGGSTAEPVTVTSDDGGTEMVFNPDGTYVFKFAAYNIEDPGTWTYEGGKLVVTNANGAAAEAEGDPLKFHYVSAVSDQLGGDYTINAADLPAGGSASGGGSTAEPVTVTSDDGGTEMVFNPDGTYVFKFAAYNIEDPGTWTYEGGKLVVTNANGAAAEAEGDPLKLHYVSAVSDQLGGDYTINAADLPG